MQVFGVPENTPGTTDEKILSLLNGNMKMQPPIVLEDIDVSHRVVPTRPPPSTGDQNVLPQDGDPNSVAKHPRAILVKFANLHVKSRVMVERLSRTTLVRMPMMVSPGFTYRMASQSAGRTSTTRQDS